MYFRTCNKLTLFNSPCPHSSQPSWLAFSLSLPTSHHTSDSHQAMARLLLGSLPTQQVNKFARNYNGLKGIYIYVGCFGQRGQGGN